MHGAYNAFFYIVQLFLRAFASAVKNDIYVMKGISGKEMTAFRIYFSSPDFEFQVSLLILVYWRDREENTKYFSYKPGPKRRDRICK